MINKSIKKIQKSRRLRHQRLAPVLACAMFLLCSCNSEFMSPDGENGESVPLSISELHLEGSLNEENDPDAVTRTVTTRAVTPGTVTTGGATIKVFQLATNGYMGEYNVKCTYADSDGDGAFQWELAKSIGIDKRVSAIVGIYDPNNLGVFSDSNTGTVTSVDLTAQLFDETKLWYMDNSHATVTNTNPAVAFQMVPAYSRMVLQIERDATYLSDCKITEVTLTSGGNFFNNLPLDISKGELSGIATAYNAATNPLLTKPDGFVTIASGTKSIDLLLPPQTITGSGLIVSLKIDDEVRSVTIPQGSLPKLASGSQYIVPLKILGPATLILNGNVADNGWGTASSVGNITDASGM